jgi:hypothetical protein
MSQFMKVSSILLSFILFFASLLDGYSQPTYTDGDWTYTLNGTDATITGYSGSGGAIAIPPKVYGFAIADGYTVKRVGGSWPPILGYENTSVTSVSIPSGVTDIGAQAFWGAKGLTNVSLPNTLLTIGGMAFEGCANLMSIIIPDSVTSVARGAFAECLKISTLAVGPNLQFEQGQGGLGQIFGPSNNITHLIYTEGTQSTYPFEPAPATKISTVTLPSTLTNIADDSFNSPSLTNVSIPDGVLSIGRGAFQQSGLVNVVIPNSVTNIGGSAFGSCTNLQSVVLPSSLSRIQSFTFWDCKSLSSIAIPPSVKSIEDSAFSYSGLKSISLPQGLTNLGIWAFAHTALSNIVVPEGIRLIGLLPFEGAPITNAAIPAKFVAQYGAMGLPPEISSSLFLSALTNVFGFATKTDVSVGMSNSASQAIAQVQSAPNNYNLYSPAQYQANYSNGVTAGTSLVTANPANYNLYTSNSIMDLRMGGAMVQKQGNNAVVSFQPQTTTDLTQPFTNNGTPITNTIPMPGNKGFLRIQAKPQ